MMLQEPKNEAIKSDAGRQYDPAAVFAEIPHLAARICGTSMALLYLVDGTRYAFNLELLEVSLWEVDFWAHTVVQPDVLVVEDTSQDVRFANNPKVTSSPYIRFYAGVPLITSDGHAVGALCVLDSVQRELTQLQIDALQGLSRQVIAQRELQHHFSDLRQTALQCQQREKSRPHAEEEYLTVLEQVQDGIFILQGNQLLFVNQPFAKMLGYTVAELKGIDFSALVAPEDRRKLGQTNRRGRARVPEPQTSDFRLLHKHQANPIRVSVKVAPISYQGSVASLGLVKMIHPGRLVAGRDGKFAVPALPNSYYDLLTGLLNHAGLMKCVEFAIEQSKQQPRDGFAVLFLNIDHFKRIKCSLGYRLAEQLLVAFAHRLQTCLRAGDPIGHLGSDEFGIVVHHIKNINDSLAIAERLHESLKVPFLIERQEVFITVSIGIALSVGLHAEVTSRRKTGQNRSRLVLQDVAAHEHPTGEQETKAEVDSPLNGVVPLRPPARRLNDLAAQQRPEDLLRDAGVAMYSAKAQGKASSQVFNAGMHTRVLAGWRLETDLRRAIHDNAHLSESTRHSQFILHYQPIVSLGTGTLAGFEALVRWLHPERGLVSPTEFIPVAEQTGLIVPLGAWVLREACLQMRWWQEQFPAAQQLTMSVNLSGIQLSQPALLAQIDETLQYTGIQPSCLKLEITESVVMDNADAATAVLEQLRDRNIQLCIDDFGTGYSSLSYLRRFPINTLKIDRSFVSAMCDEAENSEIVRAIVMLANNLGMQVVAEGIETPAQMQLLSALQCEYGQGYYFSKPIDSDTAGALISAVPAAYFGG
ncbi:EAL domain-containing protein [Microcoleus sp. FACHB-68]|uniref:sensor domain-containing phosphodiesterase n=1 Tax=Microcoleus sp. FACHB-68 TaxID=2692826 RepID=UPI0016833EDD|nr:EAL domain-containing protein [Microcoleus sp. FACHB-68]MBD1938144.1 EAL domain-containing protein [Microcoleus sp. FACHB-68]